MSAHYKLRSHSPLKTVLNRLGDAKPTVIAIRHTLWLPTTEGQDNPWIGTLTQLERILMLTFHKISIMRTQMTLKCTACKSHQPGSYYQGIG